MSSPDIKEAVDIEVGDVIHFGEFGRMKVESYQNLVLESDKAWGDEIDVVLFAGPLSVTRLVKADAKIGVN